MRRLSAPESAFIRLLASTLSRSGPQASMVVLIYHRVLSEPDPMLPDEPDAARFSAEIDLLRSCFNVLPLADAVRRLHTGSLPARALSITFDDGYANNCDVALPILSAKGVPFTVFVAPGFLDGGRMFNDTLIETLRRAPVDLDLRAEGLGTLQLRDPASRRVAVEALLSELKYLQPDDRIARIGRIAAIAGASLPDDLMMTSGQVRKLHRSGVEIGAHTISHPILTSVGDDVAREQIRDSKQRLEALIGSPVRSFAYPNGKPGRDYDSRHVTMAREAGFDLALSTAWGAVTGDSDRFQIPRVAAWDRQPFKYGLRLGIAYRDRHSQVA